MSTITKPDGVSWNDIFRRTFKEASDDDLLGRSAQLSYYFFLALFPMLVSIIAVMSVFGGADSFKQTLFGFLAGVLPGSASDLIQKTLTEVSQAHGGLKMSLGILFSLWSASAGMSAIMDTLNAEYEVSEGRSFIRRNATAIGLSVVCALLMVAAVTIVLAGGSPAQAFSFGTRSAILRVALWP
jgi:membrane protein